MSVRHDYPNYATIYIYRLYIRSEVRRGIDYLRVINLRALGKCIVVESRAEAQP